MSKGRHRRRTRRSALSVAALSVAATVGGVAATQPSALTGPLVDLTALIVVGSSTHPDGTGNEAFFEGKFNQAPYNPGGLPGPDLVGVDFGSGAAGIADALQAVSGDDNAILSSGWGAANASLVLARLNKASDPALPATLFVLDNNVARPDGGFGTRYPLFALIGVNPFPSPADTTAKAVVDVAYEYNYNSNAPASLLNVVAHVNSLVAYLYGYRDQDQVSLPVDVDGNPTVSCGGANTCAVLASGADALPCEDARCDTPTDDRVVAYVTTRGNTTYVTYTTEELPLARLIRDVVPFGDALADFSEPLLKLVVDSAYYGGNPIPSDPSRYRPARLMSPLPEIISTASKVPAAIHEGWEATHSRPADQMSETLRRNRSSPEEPVADVAPEISEAPGGDEDIEAVAATDVEAEGIVVDEEVDEGIDENLEDDSDDDSHDERSSDEQPTVQQEDEPAEAPADDAADSDE